MTVTSVTFSKANEQYAADAPVLRKRDLEAMRDRAVKAGNNVPGSLDALINRFDEVAGSGGTLTIRQVRTFTADQVASAPSAVATPPSPSPAGDSGLSAMTTARMTRASSGAISAVGPDDVGFATEGLLKLLATRGDATAVRELEMRALAKGTAPASI